MGSLAAMVGDITTVEVDAIVNAANSTLMGGGGVDGAIHRAGGPEILAECRAIVAQHGQLPTGQAVITTAGALPARYVIHTVGPVWSGDDPEAHDTLLASCYRQCLRLAVGAGIQSIAFPAISTGVYGFPKDRAARIAVNTVGQQAEAVRGSIEEIVFVCYSEEDLNLYRQLGIADW